MSIVSNALRVLDRARAKLDTAGLCPYRAFVRMRTWTGERPGVGGFSDVDTELTVANGKHPQVRVTGQKSVAAPGTTLEAGQFEIGPLTPAYAGGGVDITTFDPLGTKNKELFYVLVGPGLPATGMLCKKVKDDLSSPFRYLVTVQATGQKA